MKKLTSNFKLALSCLWLMALCQSGCATSADSTSGMARPDFDRLSPAAEVGDVSKTVEKPRYRLVPRSYSGGGPGSSMRRVRQTPDLSEEELLSE